MEKSRATAAKTGNNQFLRLQAIYNRYIYQTIYHIAQNSKARSMAETKNRLTGLFQNYSRLKPEMTDFCITLKLYYIISCNIFDWIAVSSSFQNIPKPISQLMVIVTYRDFTEILEYFANIRYISKIQKYEIMVKTVSNFENIQ